MYPMHFMERFWRGEPKDELFVAIPLVPKFDSRFDTINKAAKEVEILEGARRSKEILEGSNAIFTDILKGIANSRMVLCDLSDDPRGPKDYANGSVLYEAGIAMTIREPNSVVLIREQSPDSIKDFDVKVSRICSPPDGEITEPWLVNVLNDALKAIDWAQTERIKVIAESLDDICLELIERHGRNPDGRNHFALVKGKSPIEFRLAAQRLVDLGLLRFATGKPERQYEYAYRWTSLAKPLMKHLEIRQLTNEEFEQDKERRERWQSDYEKYLVLQKLLKNTKT